MKKGISWCLLASLIVACIMIAGCSKGSGSQSLADLINKGKQIKSMSADYAATTPDGKTAGGTIWGQKGKLFKIETTVNGVKNVIILNYIDKTMIMYEPAIKRGTKMKLSQSQSKPPGDYLNDIDLSKVQDFGTAVISGETCRVFQYTNADGATIKMWLSVDLGFPAQITSTTADGQTTTAKYTNVKAGPLPSGTFSVPAGVKITDLTSTSPQKQPSQQ